MKNNIKVSNYSKALFNFDVEELRREGFLKSIPKDKKVKKLSIGETIDGHYKMLFYAFEKADKSSFGSFILIEEKGSKFYEPDLGFDFPEENLNYKPEEKKLTVLYSLIETQQNKVVDKQDFEIGWKLIERRVEIRNVTAQITRSEIKYDELNKKRLQSISNVGKLKLLDQYIAKKRIDKTYEGDPYNSNLNWKFYRCYLNEPFIRDYFKFSDSILTHSYDGKVAGAEFGFYDEFSGIGVMGIHENYITKNTIKIHENIILLLAADDSMTNYLAISS